MRRVHLKEDRDWQLVGNNRRIYLLPYASNIIKYAQSVYKMSFICLLIYPIKIIKPLSNTRYLGCRKIVIEYLYFHTYHIWMLNMRNVYHRLVKKSPPPHFYLEIWLSPSNEGEYFCSPCILVWADLLTYFNMVYCEGDVM